MAAEEWRILIQEEVGAGAGAPAGAVPPAGGTSEEEVKQKTKTFFEQFNQYWKNWKPFIITGGLLYVMYHSSQIVSETMKTIGQILGAIMDVILLPLMPIFVAIVNAIVPLIPHIQRISEAFFKPIVDWIVPKIKWIGNWLANLDWEAVERGARKAGETVAGWIQTLWEWAVLAYGWIKDTGIPWIKDAAIDIKDWFTGTLWPWVTDTFVPWFTDTFIPWVTGPFWDSVKTTATSIYNWFATGDGKLLFDKVKGFVESIAGWVGDAYDWYLQHKEKIGEFFKDPIKFVEDWYKQSALKTWIDDIKTHIVSIVGTLTSIYNKVLEFLGDPKDETAEFIASKWPGIGAEEAARWETVHNSWETAMDTNTADAIQSLLRYMTSKKTGEATFTNNEIVAMMMQVKGNVLTTEQLANIPSFIAAEGGLGNWLKNNKNYVVDVYDIMDQTGQKFEQALQMLDSWATKAKEADYEVPGTFRGEWWDKVGGVTNLLPFGTVVSGINRLVSGQIGIGNVPKTGLYQLHEGERVLRAGEDFGNNIEQTNIFNIEIGTNGSVDDLAREIETKITRSLSTILRRV